MDGFNVLNTIAGEAVTAITVLGWILLVALVVGLLSLGTGASEEDDGLAGFGLFLIAISIVSMFIFGMTDKTGEITPTRYEITLKPGVIIDAARYEITEQRGEIYVIKER